MRGLNRKDHDRISPKERPTDRKTIVPERGSNMSRKFPESSKSVFYLVLVALVSVLLMPFPLQLIDLAHKGLGLIPLPRFDGLAQ
jgi:hypothetical protein